VQRHVAKRRPIRCFLHGEDFFGAPLSRGTQCAFTLLAGLATRERAALEIGGGSDEHGYGIRIGDDDLRTFGMHRTARWKKQHLAGKADLVFVIRSLAQNQRVLSARSRAEVGWAVHACAEGDRPFPVRRQAHDNHLIRDRSKDLVRVTYAILRISYAGDPSG
jgi:hypothetical protein